MKPDIPPVVRILLNADPDPDPGFATTREQAFLILFFQCWGTGSASGLDPVFGPSGSESGFVSKKYGSGSGTFHNQAKKVRKTLISTVL